MVLSAEAFPKPTVPGRVSVIIPVRADVDGLRITLDSLKAAAPASENYEILVANDGADPAISAECARQQTIEIALNPNRGPGGARNAAIERASGEFLAFLDADVVVRPGWWEAMRAALADADYVGGRIDIDPGLIENFWHRYDELTAFDVKGYMSRQHGATANLAVRREVIEKVGVYDARFRSGEDTEFGIRVHEAGLRQAYADDMVVWHPPRSFAQQRRKIYRVVMGHLQLAAAFPDRFGKYRLTPRLAVSLLSPPRTIGKDPALFHKHRLAKRVGLYLTRYATRVYVLLCYLWLMATGFDKPHDLS